MRKFWTAGRAGFTLIEILISLVVLAIGCLAALSMQTSTMEDGSQAYSLTVATFLAESETERLQALSRGRVLSLPSTPVSLARDGTACPADGSKGPCYIRTVKVLDQYPTTQSVMVSIEVTFPGPGRRSQIYDMIISYTDFT